MGKKTHDFDQETGINKIEHDGYTLRIHYESGRVFDYEDVSDELVTNLIHSINPRHFILHHIKPGRDPVKVKANSPFPEVV